jgi:uroporphyrinogen decarboxylase
MEGSCHRDRILAALAHRQPDAVPFDCTFTLGAYRALVDHLGLAEPDPTPNPWLEVRPSPRVADCLDLDFAYLDFGRPAGTALFTLGMTQYTDEWGLTYRRVNAGGGRFSYEPVDPPLAAATLLDLEEYPWPDPMDPGWTEGLEERGQRLHRTGRAVILELPASIFETAYLLRGMERFLMDLVLDPHFANRLMEICAGITIALARSGLRKAGKWIDVVKHLDDQGAQTGPLVSPRTFRRLICPHFTRLFQAVHDEFARCNPNGKVMTHTDGAVYPLIEDYIRAGIDILNPVQPNAAGMDHARLKREFGSQLTFHGGVDVQGVMPFGSPQDVRDEVRRRIHDLASGGGYILAPSHNLQQDVPPANILALRDAVRTFGRYPLD